MEISLAENLDYRISYAVPVTLRQVEKVGIPLDSDFGGDESEREMLLDDENILRIVFGVEIDGFCVSETVSLECLNVTLQKPQEVWYPCLARYLNASGCKMNVENNQRKRHVWRLLGQICPDYQDTLNNARKAFDKYVAECRQNNND